MPQRYIPNDKWSRKAAEEGYRARSVYKLMELDERFHLLLPGQVVLDIGAAPGSWLQYASKKVGEAGRIIGMDITEIKPMADNVGLYRVDVTDFEELDRIMRKEAVEQVDLVLSDIAPNTSGIKDIDQWRSVELVQAVLTVAAKYLKPKGKCVVKIFRGADFDMFLREVKLQWDGAKTVTVQASRDRSKEVYLVMTKR